MPLRRTAAALAVAAGLVAAAPAAQAGCGGVRVSAAQKHLGNFRAPMIIGDSVLLGAVEQVARQGYEVNARGCRSWAEGARLVRQRARAGTLPHLVVMFLGADWMVTKAQIRETFFRIGHDRVLVLMTPRELGGRGGEDAQNMREVVREYPTRGFLLDWVRHTRDRSSWFASDGLHLGLPGIGGLARFSRRALRFAPPGKFPGPPPPDRAPSPTA
jgi:hypothetical protein